MPPAPPRPAPATRTPTSRSPAPALNPVIVIPTYWSAADRAPGVGERGAYDYTTPIDKPVPELQTCLESLERVRGVLRVVVLVVAEPEIARRARGRVDAICRAHPALNPLVVGEAEAACVRKAVGRTADHVPSETVALRGYGAIRNMGLAVSAAFGHDVVVFLDDDVVVTDEDFLIDGVYGLGALTRQDLLIAAKSGYFVDEAGSPYARPSDEWSERYWTKAADFNKVMERAQSATRITRSNHMFGGCCALHAAAYTKVPFDPYLTRGEDLDYVLDLRARGFDVWFDNAWSVSMRKPTEMLSKPALFMQDTYRWLYEYRKLEAMNSRRDLRTITQESLMPYPAPWLFPEVRDRVRKTAWRRFLTGPDRAAYLRIITRGRRDADRYATMSSTRYLSFALVWPTVAAGLWDDRFLQGALLRTGSVAPAPAASGARAADPLPAMPVAASDVDEAEPAEALADAASAASAAVPPATKGEGR